MRNGLQNSPQESIECPGRRSRLRDSEEVNDALSYNLVREQ